MNNHHTLLTAELKERLDIVEVISAYLPLKRNGAGYKGSCPFHDDKNLSLDVFPETQTWRCATGCAERLLLNDRAQSDQGDALAFVSRVEGGSFSQAVRKLAVRCALAPGTGEIPTLPDAAIKGQTLEPMPRGHRISGLFQSREAMRTMFPPPEDPYLKLGNLGYKGRVSGMGLEGLEGFNRFRNGRQPRPGIVVALHTTLQGHCELERPGQRHSQEHGHRRSCRGCPPRGDDQGLLLADPTGSNRPYVVLAKRTKDCRWAGKTLLL